MGLFRGLLNRLRMRPMRERVAERYHENEILRSDKWANCFGVQSRGVTQLRGNGTLVLTAGTLHFFMILPQREERIPLGDVERTEIVRSHLGKTVGRDLLKVHFRRAGEADSIAWYVKDPAAWRAAIEQRRAAHEV